MTTGTPGYLALSLRTSSAVIDAASEQPATRAGSRTVRLGLRILAVSAMKRTPQKTMMSASDTAALRLSSSESPMKSGML